MSKILIEEALAQPELCKYGQEPKSCTSSPMDCQCALDAALAQQEQEPVTDTEHINRGCHYQTELTQPAHPCIACGAETGHADWCARVRWGIEKPAQQCTGCEGNPSPQNNPCAVCGKPAQQEPWGACVSGRVFVGRLPEYARKFSEDDGVPIQWLYTSLPPQRKPLTRDQVRETMTEAGYDIASPQERADFINGIRHGEAAHGIKEKNT